MNTMTIAQRVAALQAQRAAGIVQPKEKVAIGVAIGNVAAKVEDNVIRATSSYLDTRNALAQERKELGFRNINFSLTDLLG